MVGNRVLIRCIFVASIFTQLSVRAIIHGSDIAVSIFPAVAFPSVDTDNMMFGFGWFKNGITLEDSLTTCTFQSVYPVSGTLAFNGGTLCLQEDLVISNTAILVGGANIIANNHSVHLCSSIMSLDSTYTFHDVRIILNSDVAVRSNLVFKGECLISGRFHHLHLDGGSIFVAANSRLIFDELYLDNIAGKNVACADSSASIVLRDTEWNQSGDFCFAQGALKTLNEVDFRGSYSFVYDSVCTSTIGAGSTWAMNGGVILNVGRKNGNEPLCFESHETSVLRFQDSSLLISESGVQLTGGQIVVDGNITIDSSLTSTDVGLIFGNGIASDDIGLTLNSGAVAQFRSGWMVHNNAVPDKFFASSRNAAAIRYGDSKAYVKNNWLFPEMTLRVVGQPTTVVNDGASLNYNNVHFNFGNVECEFTGVQVGSEMFVLAGNGLLFLSKGTFEPYLGVMNKSNMLWGSGDIAGPVALLGSDAQLSINLNGSILSNPALGGGTIILENDLYLGPANTCMQTGTVDLGFHQCVFGSEDQTWTSTLVWKDGSITLNSHVLLNGSWFINGTCTINGNGNMLDLDGIGNVIVADGATLILKNIRIRGLSGDQLRCMNDASTLVLDNVTWEQDGDFVFSQGRIKWVHDVKMKGKATFAYLASQDSIIEMESSLEFGPGFVFHYNPADSLSEHIVFEDSSATLILNGATLSAASMCFTNGILQVLRNSFLKADTHSDGFTFGSCDAAHDIEVYIGAGVHFVLQDGVLNYKNKNIASLILCSATSVLTIDSGARLNVYESMNMGAGVLLFGDSATFARVTGKDALGTVQPQGRLFYTNIV